MPATVVFAAQVYDLSIIKKAAYRFSDVMSIDIVPRDGQIECVLHLPANHTEEDRAALVAAFRNEVLDQDLRAAIARETEAMRNTILAYALSKTGLQGRE